MSWEITLKKKAITDKARRIMNNIESDSIAAGTIISDDLATTLRIAKQDLPNRIRALEKILKLYSHDLTISSIQQECAITKDSLERLQEALEGFN